ncbi:E3 ubiquitin-protein ligase TRIM39-like [Mixophyes fleayi]|uniref:E3 ubiquitin-protein ligase TRIM39-like n=1 Tax=Mixophyes fleayi TaxID=3061075 RepID=UPI003F4E1A9B
MAEAQEKKRPCCPICTNFYEEPVTIECGHSFCKKCLMQQWDVLRDEYPCPECKEIHEEIDFIPNKCLAEKSRVFKQMDHIIRKLMKTTQCKQHKRPLEYFCNDEQRAICSICRKAEEHNSHDVTNTLKIVLICMEDIQKRLKPLKWHLEELQMFKTQQEKNRDHLKTKIENQRQKVLSEFEELHQLLEREKEGFLSILSVREKEITQRMEDNLAKLEEQSSTLSRIISEIEEKFNGSPVKLLKEAQNLLERCENATFQEPQLLFPECEPNFYSAPRQYMALKQIIKNFQVDLAHVTLDEKTANCQLSLSRDKRSVKWTKEKQVATSSQLRFDTVPCVLGTQGFSTGRYYWEVQVDITGDWAVGIAKKWVSREGRIKLAPSCGIWAIRHILGHFFILTSPAVKLSLSEKPRTIRLYLDMEIRQLTLYNAENREHIHTFSLSSSKSFFPFFWSTCETEMRLC